MKELPLVEDYGEGFRSRIVEWGGMIVSYETFPKGVDATPLFKGLPGGRGSQYRSNAEEGLKRVLPCLR